MAAAEKWNAMSDEEKWEFDKAADEERAQHKIVHPYYVQKSEERRVVKTRPNKKSGEANSSVASVPPSSALGTRIKRGTPSPSPIASSSNLNSPAGLREFDHETSLTPLPSAYSAKIMLADLSSDDASPPPSSTELTSPHPGPIHWDTLPLFHGSTKDEDQSKLTLQHQSVLCNLDLDPFIPCRAYVPEIENIPQAVVPLPTIMSTLSMNVYPWDICPESLTIGTDCMNENC